MYHIKKTQLIIILILTFISFDLNSQSLNNKSEILILGTPHLNQIEGFKPEMIKDLLNKLNEYDFDAVCIENMPSELLYDIRSRRDVSFKSVLDYYGGDRISIADSVQTELDLNFLQIEKKFFQLIKKEHLSDQNRMNLVEYSLGLGDPVTAALHLHFIKDKSILQKSRVSTKFINGLKENVKSYNENYTIALQIAKNEEHRKIEYIDNFQDEAILYKYSPDFVQEFQDNQQSFMNIAQSPVFTKGNSILKADIKNKNLINYYRYINSSEFMKQDFQAQWQIWLDTKFPLGTDKTRYYLWEMRNLQISANIVRVISLNPGKRILVIIGASHKSFLEKYLKQLPRLELINIWD